MSAGKGEDALGWVNSLCSFPLHRHVLSDFTSDDQRHSHPSKGLGACELCHQRMITGCLVTVCWILRWESRRTQEGDLICCYLGLWKDSTKYPTCSAAVTHGEFLGDELLSWGDAALCGCTSSGLHATTRHRNAGMPHLGSSAGEA